MAEKRAMGPRVLISWGLVTKKVAGKQVKFTAYSKIPESTQKALGLKVAKATSGGSQAAAAVKKDKRGRLRLSTPGASIGSHYLLAWTGEYTKSGTQKWRRIRLPQEIGLAKAVNILLTGKKIRSIKFPNGLERVINANIAAKKKPAPKKK